MIKHLNYQQKKQVIKSSISRMNTWIHLGENLKYTYCLSTVEPSLQEYNKNFCSNQIFFLKKTLTIDCFKFFHIVYMFCCKLKSHDKCHYISPYISCRQYTTVDKGIVFGVAFVFIDWDGAEYVSVPKTLKLRGEISVKMSAQHLLPQWIVGDIFRNGSLLSFCGTQPMSWQQPGLFGGFLPGTSEQQLF